MSPPEAPALLPRSRDKEGAPVFAEPWHAEVLAIAYALAAKGVFAASAWAESLGRALEDARRHGAPDTEETYYRAALSALEGLVGDRSPETAAALPERVEEWRRAYRNTPHGKPVELAAGRRADHTAD